MSPQVIIHRLHRGASNIFDEKFAMNIASRGNRMVTHVSPLTFLNYSSFDTPVTFLTNNFLSLPRTEGHAQLLPPMSHLPSPA